MYFSYTNTTRPTTLTARPTNCLSAHHGQLGQFTNYDTFRCLSSSAASIRANNNISIDCPSHSTQYYQLTVLYMSRKAGALRSRLLDVVDGSLQFQHYFSLIKLLQTRKEEAENELNILKAEFNESEDDCKASAVAKKMAVAYRKWYGLSKEKIEVCLQFQDLIQQLTTQLNQLDSEPPTGEEERRASVSEEQTKEQARPQMAKAKSKQTKLARVTDKRQPKAEPYEENAATTLEWDENSKQPCGLANPRKLTKQ